MHTDCPAMLRVAGLPATLLAGAGNPDLFARLRAHADAEAGYRVDAVVLADRIGADLVPHPDLAGRARGLAVTVRRRLRRGDLVDPADTRRLAVITSVLSGSADLAPPLLDIAERAASLATQDTALDEAVTAEHQRLMTLPWELVTTHPDAGRVLAATAPDLVAEIRGRLADGSDWTGKRMRQRADYLLRLLSRAAFKTTPRGWLGHVALTDATGGAADPGVRLGDWAVHHVSNIHADRHDLAHAAELPDDAWLSLTAPHWTTADRHCCWAPDHDQAGGVTFVRIRSGPPVDAVRRVLEHGALRTEDVLALLVPDATGQRRTVARRFLGHLVRIGVLTAAQPPAAHLDGWHPRPADRRRTHARPGFTDVYRRARGHLPVATVDPALALARRLAAVLTEDAPAHPALDLIDDEPRSVTDLLAEYQNRTPPGSPGRPHTGWPPAEPGTPAHRLRLWLAQRPDGADIEITADLLDQLGAPAGTPVTWPVDCLLRPIVGEPEQAVLEGIAPAGVTDARFATALHQLHGRAPRADTHRDFLAETAARCAVDIVEIFIPPHDDHAANTVRRPRYTRTWTGDAHAPTYTDSTAPGRYLPLHHITLRRAGGRIIAEDPDHRVLWPVCHGTCVPPTPWATLLALLTAAAPVSRLVTPFAFAELGMPAGHTRTGRIRLDGGIVLHGRAARVSRDQLPPPGAPLGTRVRHLARLRADTGLPRWVFARADGGRRPRPVDLDSVTALRVLDRLLTDPGTSALVLEEMLPDPDHLLVRSDQDEPLAAQLLLRLPYNTDPARLAGDVARALHAEPAVVAVG